MICALSHIPMHGMSLRCNTLCRQHLNWLKRLRAFLLDPSSSIRTAAATMAIIAALELLRLVLAYRRHEQCLRCAPDRAYTQQRKQADSCKRHTTCSATHNNKIATGPRHQNSRFASMRAILTGSGVARLIALAILLHIVEINSLVR